LHQSTWDHNILYADISSDGEQRTFNKTTFTRNQKYEHGERLKVKIKILFYAENSLTVTRRRMKFVHRKIMDIPTSCIRTIVFFDGALEYGGISKL
jgi:hypothetical protein